MAGIRPTVNNSRAGKNGVYQAQHLDSEHGKAAQMNGLLYTWHYYRAEGGVLGKQSFEKVEEFFYNRELSDGLHAQNMRYKKKGNYGRIRDMDEYRKSVKTCPESTLYYLGDKDNNAGAELLKVAVMEFLMWREEEYPQVVTLDWAVHIEDGAPHVHERHVWIAHDQDGNKIVNQEAALREMGVLPPDPDKKVGRYNNAKMTYTEACREKMMEIARSYGIEVEDQPREAGRKGLSQAKFKTQDERHKALEWSEYDKQLRGVSEDLQTVIMGDLEDIETQRAEIQAKRLLTALGASVKPAEAVVVRDMRTSDTKTALDAAIEQPGQSGPIRSAKMQKVMALAERQQTTPGPQLWNGPER